MTKTAARSLIATALVLAGAGSSLAQNVNGNTAGSSAAGGATVQGLVAQGYRIVAASSDGTSQFLYLQGEDANKQKKAYACQIQFGTNGGFRGCLVLP